MTTDTDTAAVRDQVARYAPRLHAVAGGGHHVASPLGAWLLLALCGTGTGPAGRDGLAEALGGDAGTAARQAAELLGRPPPAVSAAAAAWTAPPGELPPPERQWQASLPPAVESGPVPAQEQADAWARERTGGLIPEFPARLSPLTRLVLATALATRVTWDAPFDLAPAARLGAGSPWVSAVRQVLVTPRHESGGHQQFVTRTPEAGDVIVHLARAPGLVVASVAAAAAVPAAQVLAAAYRIAPAEVTGTPVSRLDLAGLPLGEAPLWLVEEVAGPGPDTCTAVLPAWSARTHLDLSAPALGFGAAVAALGADGPWQAAQGAMARYYRAGFEAAAVTSMVRSAAAFRPAPGRHRQAQLRFAHPYAVVAVAADDSGDRPGPASGTGDGPGPWFGLPVFSAWVAEPEDAAGEP